ncbi:ferredoxin reductase family protein [Aliiruegeria sabulilitoris]|uniref:ferredoxin reductase family protein n=1 Tax=Aliiruegeria sabulilitoris TaxID=1510458 RepID=UPI000834767B|nr:ferredoxin reductase family protein [Aliiruegeria sabulilitoris]NDR59268.1 oxidoreductase [Pseudoruegeria sp. M32A2M]
MTKLSTDTPRSAPLAFPRLLMWLGVLVLVPYGLALSQGLEIRNIYTELVTALSIAGLAAMLLQFVLAGRIGWFIRHAGLDQSMLLHRRAGQCIAALFLLHPFLIVLPRFIVAPQLAAHDIWLTFTAAETATGFYAMALLVVLVLTSVFKDRLPISYEAWRLSHGTGFAIVAILATDHAITNGRHGVYNHWFDAMWIALCAAAVASLLDTYLWQPYRRKRRPFCVAAVERVSARDSLLTIEKDGDFPFDFKAGQFAWINTSGHTGNLAEHPFSIASTPQDLPRLSFIIRNLGDYTANLAAIETGQRVYLDGPFGDFTLENAPVQDIVLIAGGAGIGPILGLLRQLRSEGCERSVRLIYGSRNPEDVVARDEIAAAETEMADFKATLVLENAPDDSTESGLLDRMLLSRMLSDSQIANAAIYVCGPPMMTRLVVRSLRAMGVSRQRIRYEKLSF